jgi:thioredoxin domain-containing protein 5
MQHTLAIAEVNCEDHASLCATQGVQGYPVLYFYANGIKAEYTGGRKLEQLKAFADRASAPFVLTPTTLLKTLSYR